MLSFAQTLVWASVVLVILWRVDLIAHAVLSLHTVPASTHDAEAVVIPDDLEAFALEEVELWAQEQVRDVIRERYTDLKDWNLVRRAVGIGDRDA